MLVVAHGGATTNGASEVTFSPIHGHKFSTFASEKVSNLVRPSRVVVAGGGLVRRGPRGWVGRRSRAGVLERGTKKRKAGVRRL